MSPIKNSFIAALVSASLMGACFYFSQHRREQEAAHLRAENNRLLRAAYQRHQRETVANYPTTQATSSIDHGSPAQHRAVPGSPKKPNEDYRNEGQSSALAALQTFAWACDRGDTAAVEKLLCFEGEARKVAQAFMESLPAKVRSQWNSPEAMAATLLTDQIINHPFPAARILATATIVSVNTDRVALQLPDTGRKLSEYQKTSEGWKYLITEAMVNDYVNRSRQSASQ